MASIGSTDPNGLLVVPGSIVPSPSPSPSSRPSSLWRLSSLDTLLEYQKACSEEKRLTQSSTQDLRETMSLDSVSPSEVNKKRFRCTAAEIGFCCSMIITQLLAEYLISGFSVLLPELKSVLNIAGPSSYWPASILSLLLCSTILTFARVSDMYGGYPLFMSSMVFLSISSVIAGLTTSQILLDICRAMQGLSLAASTPASYALIGTIYAPGPRRNLILGICCGSAPLGFFAGICTSAALPSYAWSWYFWIAAGLAILAASLAYLCVPADHSNNSRSTPLSMDWLGAATITSSLILLAYALSASAATPTSWRSPNILVPFILGIVLLASSIYIEARLSASPLLPAKFFAPKSVTPFCACALFLHAAFGIWLFTSTAFLATTYHISGVTLALYYLPLALGGITISIVGGAILHRVPITLALLLSSLFWITANLLLAFADPEKGYWAFVFPAMIAATLGVDGVFTVSCVFLSSVQKVELQGLAGAMGSLLVNGGIVVGLGGVQVLMGVMSRKFEVGAGQAEGTDGVLTTEQQRIVWRAAFLFAAACAGVGMVLVALFVRIERGVVDGVQRGDVEEVGSMRGDGETMKKQEMVDSVVELTIVVKHEDDASRDVRGR